VAPTKSRRTAMSVAALAGAAVTVASIGTALAISGGGYSLHKQGCGKRASSFDREDRKQPKGCHDLQFSVSDRKGTFFEVGTNTTKEGQNPHAADLMVSPDGSGNPKGKFSGTGVSTHVDTKWQPIPDGQCGVFDLITYPIGLATGGGCKLDPSQWSPPAGAPAVHKKFKVGKHLVVVPDVKRGEVYFGADDGLDSGEHDEPDGKRGTKHEQNGPSDGGAIVVRWHPAAATAWLPMVLAGAQNGNLSKLATTPFPVIDGGFGACADGICFSAQSKRQTAYRGGGKGRKDVYNYDGRQWDPYNCSGASTDAEKQCHDKTHKNEDNYWRHSPRHNDVQPGFQFFEDPDPNGSPAAPLYPLPSVYAGTCGVTAGGGQVQAPKSPLTNKSGQVSVSPTHC
jgi:hypothetical protein